MIDFLALKRVLEQTWEWGGACHVNMKAEVGVTLPEAKEHRGFLAERTRKKGADAILRLMMERILKRRCPKQRRTYITRGRVLLLERVGGEEWGGGVAVGSFRFLPLCVLLSQNLLS